MFMFQPPPALLAKAASAPEKRPAAGPPPMREPAAPSGPGGAAPEGAMKDVFGHLAEDKPSGTFDPQLFVEGMAAMTDFSRRGKIQHDEFFMKAVIQELQENANSVEEMNEEGRSGEWLKLSMQNHATDRKNSTDIAEALRLEATLRGLDAQNAFFQAGLGDEAYTTEPADAPRADFGPESVYTIQDHLHGNQSTDFGLAKDDPELFMDKIRRRNKSRRSGDR
jgi:hypothetical protein